LRCALLELLEQAAHARRVHLDREVVVAGILAAMRAVVSPMPEPISTTTGAARPKSAAKSGVERDRARRARQQLGIGALLAGREAALAKT
jgi:hypothetical protein